MDDGKGKMSFQPAILSLNARVPAESARAKSAGFKTENWKLEL